MSPLTVGVIGVAVLILLLLSRMPVGFVMALVGFGGFSYLVSVEGGLSIVGKDIYSTFSSYSLTVIPLFVLMGQFAFNSGVSRRLYNAAYKWLGHMRGGLAMATIGACAGFAAVSGSSPATAATMGAIALPEMRKYKYDPALATGSIAAGGSMGILIPPSVVFILYGIMTQQSIGKLFAAGLVPGLLEAALYLFTIYVICRRNISAGPPGPKATFKEKLVSLAGIGEALVLFVLVIGGLLVGFFTPTEAGAVGAFGTLLIGLLRRQLTWQGFIDSLFETLRTATMILMIVGGATIFGHFLAVTRIPFELASWVAALPLPPFAIMGMIIVMYLIGGLFMDPLALILLTVPIFFPVAMAMGFDPIWFGVIIVRVTEMGLITPPVGLNVYVIKGVAKDVPLETIFKGIFPFLLADVFEIALLMAFPIIALFLPSLMR